MLRRSLILASIVVIFGCAHQETFNERQIERQREEIHQRWEREKREAQQREAPQRASQRATQSITRTVEGFTLGIDENQAFSIFTSGIKNGSLVLKVDPSILIEALRSGSSANFMASKGLWLSSNLRISTVDRSMAMKTHAEWEELEGKSSVLFSSPTMEAIQLSFFQSKLFAINLIPRADYDVVEKALQDKYGPSHLISLVPLIDLDGLKETFTHTLTHTGKMWADPLTTLTLAKNVGSTCLIYLDVNLDNLREEYSKTQQRQREEEKQRIRSTLPKNY